LPAGSKESYDFALVHTVDQIQATLTGAAVALSFALAACGGDPPPPKHPPGMYPPMQTAAPAPWYGAPPPAPVAPPAAPPNVEAAQEAGMVKLSSALLVGGAGLSEEATRTATADFQASFEAGVAHFRRCYGAFAAKLPQPELKLWIDITIKPDGSVAEAKPDQEGQTDPAMMACVIAAFKQLTYKPHPGEIFAVTAPVSFKPQ